MITDIKNSTAIWKENQEKMMKDILEHNYVLRKGMDNLICNSGNETSIRGDPNNVFKLNEIGDSWEVIISGKDRHMKMYWLIMFLMNYYLNKKSEDKISIRIGVTDAPNLKDKLKELNRLSNNKILDHADENYKYYEYAKDLEDIADHDSNDNQKDTSFIALSKCFFDGLNTQTTSFIDSFYELFNNNNNNNDNELLLRN